MTSIPTDAHEWFSFEDETRKRIYMFDITFLESNWSCIFGSGCKGVLDEDAASSYRVAAVTVRISVTKKIASA